MNILRGSKLTLCILLGSTALFGIEVEVEKTNDWGSGFCADEIIVEEEIIIMDFEDL